MSLQLKPFYMDFVSQLPASPNQSAVRGLNLLFLLVENRLAEFHSELELMEDEERATECVMFPVRLEQFLMVGSYDQARGGYTYCLQGGGGSCTCSWDLITNSFCIEAGILASVPFVCVCTKCMANTFGGRGRDHRVSLFALAVACIFVIRATPPPYAPDDSMVFIRAFRDQGRTCFKFPPSTVMPVLSCLV